LVNQGKPTLPPGYPPFVLFGSI